MVICCGYLPLEFAGAICCRNLPQLFAVAFCRENLSQLFAVAFCRGNLLLLFTLGGGRSYLPSLFAVEICRNYIAAFSLKANLSWLKKNLFYMWAKLFIYENFFINSVFFLLLLWQLCTAVKSKHAIDCLALSWRRPLSYRNQSIDLRSKSMDWFLYDNGLCHERVKEIDFKALF